MWRLMATILVISDTGSVSMTVSHTDWPSEQQCIEIIQSHYQAPPPKEFNGHTVTAKVSASCVPVRESEQLPPAPARGRPQRPPQFPPGFPFQLFFQ